MRCRVHAIDMGSKADLRNPRDTCGCPIPFPCVEVEFNHRAGAFVM